MTRAIGVISLACASAMVFGVIIADAAKAGEQLIKRTELLRADLAGISGREAVIYIADLMPAAAGGKHTHYGNEFVYIIEGSLVISPDGRDSVTLKAGEAAHLAPDIIHAARNGSNSETAKVLVVLTVEKGKPLAEPAK